MGKNLTLFNDHIITNYSYFFASSRNVCLRPISVIPIVVYSESDNFVN